MAAEYEVGMVARLLGGPAGGSSGGKLAGLFAARPSPPVAAVTPTVMVGLVFSFLHLTYLLRSTE